MKTIGIDAGSRTVKVVLADGGRPVLSRRKENSFAVIDVCRELLEGLQADGMVATGYGRHLIHEHFGCDEISEIKAFALGGRAVLPACRTILDIGGQDFKVILLGRNGKVLKFEMNDKCAAGTGRFLEIMSQALGYSTPEFAAAAMSAEKPAKISSMCTVFAESEVITLAARGAPRPEVALGIHHAAVSRVVGMLQRVNVEREVLFAGGVALNRCMHELLEAALGQPVQVPDAPEMVGALGCAICCAQRAGC